MTDRREMLKLAGTGLMATGLSGFAGTSALAAASPSPSAPPWAKGFDGQRKPDLGDGRFLNPIMAGDHPDPSIFTVMTAPSGEEGTANVDFVIFPERWSVAEHSFRPPWFHMNIMSEFMGLIYGQYDAKPDGFVPGGISLHNCMLPHGPDATAFEKASTVELKPHKLTDTLAFMFETRYPQHLTSYAARVETLQTDYIGCWEGLEKKFTGAP